MTSITTETALGWAIPNRQFLDLNGNEDLLHELWKQTYEVQERAGFDPTYNCHGLTFGSRRTCIDDKSVAKILEDDSYKAISHAEVAAGDVVIYLDPEGGPHHSGVVVAVTTGLLKGVKVVSKWGAQGGEYIHWVHRSVYGTDFTFYRVNRSAQTALVSQIILGSS